MQKLHVVCFRQILLMQGSYSGLNWLSPVWIQTFLVYLGLKSGLYFCLKLVFLHLIPSNYSATNKHSQQIDTIKLPILNHLSLEEYLK